VNPGTVYFALQTLLYTIEIDYDRTPFEPLLLKACTNNDRETRRSAYSTYFRLSFREQWSEEQRSELALKGLSDPDSWVRTNVIKRFWGRKVDKKLENRFIEQSRMPSHKRDVIYYFLSTRPDVSKQVAERLVEILSDGSGWDGRAAWGISHHRLTREATEIIRMFCRNSIGEEDRPAAIKFMLSQMSRFRDSAIAVHANNIISTSTNAALRKAAADYVRKVAGQ